MMSIEYINTLAREASERAQSEGKEPETFAGLGHDGIRARVSRIPFLGKDAKRDGEPYVPAGWERVDAPAAPKYMACEKGYLFADSSSFGTSDEPALSLTELTDYIYNHRDLGYGIVEAGQFQVVIATYRRVH